jgi:hypothetical protein
MEHRSALEAYVPAVGAATALGSMARADQVAMEKLCCLGHPHRESDRCNHIERVARDCPKFCVQGRVDHHAAKKPKKQP